MTHGIVCAMFVKLLSKSYYNITCNLSKNYKCDKLLFGMINTNEICYMLINFTRFFSEWIGDVRQ